MIAYSSRLRKILDQNPISPSEFAAIGRGHDDMHRQPGINAHDAYEALRWIDRARSHIAESERDLRQFEHMEMAAEIRRGIQVLEESLAQSHGGQVGAVSTQFHSVLL